MNDSLLLTEQEIEDITGYQKAKCQLRALKTMKIRAKQNARGSVVVSRRHAEQVLMGNDAQSAVTAAPNLDWMKH
ncbi:DUF4224 domain-containing protein [Endozoicomonas ascidiicola]|uniref:DUF4224 domain-containing protein n=1 Tax=Endozoicomonas ascidiicola TaxID=1698521 RepID=UPI00082C3938|nr:DUF4224 domain-containing protein [Endozoicomonas ascidiicola]